jgi:predicted ribosome quality control (RQC) complex YloA/Tae2 family protein
VSFDSLMLAAVRDELRRELLGGQVQRVVVTGPLSIGLEVYAHRHRRFLICSAEPEAARVCLAEERPVRASDKPTPLLLLLRKHVRDGRLTDFDQPPFERVLRIRVAKYDDEGRPGEVTLIIETMGRRSNVVLVGADGTVLDALKRVGPTRNPRRPVLPHYAYREPPAQNRLDPLAAETYARLAEEATERRPLAELLASRLAGFSPLAAREVAFRAGVGPAGPASPLSWQRLQLAVGQLLAPLEDGRWSACLALRDGQVIAFAPYLLTHLADCELMSCASPSEAVELGLAPSRAPRAAQPAHRELLAEIDLRRDSLRRKRAALARALDSAAASEALRQAGEAILANLHQIQAGQRRLEFAGQQVELDAGLTPLENAERYFRDYRKARDANRQLPRLLAEADLQLRQLDELRALTEVADNAAALRALRQELRGDEPADRPAGRAARGRPPGGGREVGRVGRGRTADGLELLVGQTARGNDLVTFKLAGPDDLWLHARGVPGAHVILRTGGREPAESSLLEAARAAARSSQAHAARRVEVDVTARKYVRKVPAAPPGLVTYSHERTLAIELA